MQVSPLARALLAMAAARWCAWAQEPLTVAVFNRAGAPRPVLASAVDAARHAFLAAGVQSRWVLCNQQECPADVAAGDYFEILVVPKLRTSLAGRAGDHPAGYALANAFAHPRGYVLYDGAKVVADRTLRPMDLVVGCILVHEIGHLLGLGHQRSGVMRANMEALDMDNAVRGRAFDAGEGKALRAAVSRFHAVAARRNGRNQPGGSGESGDAGGFEDFFGSAAADGRQHGAANLLGGEHGSRQNSAQ
jgi:Putative peptidase family